MPIDGVRVTPRDPDNCKACPDWNDLAGRCRVPIGQRRALCGSDAARHEAGGRRARFDLYDDPVLSRAEAKLRELAEAASGDFLKGG